MLSTSVNSTLKIAACVAGLFGLLGIPSFAWADHGAPAPQLGGAVLCVQPSSVQLRLEGASLPNAGQRVREAVLRTLQTTLETESVPYVTDCLTSEGYVLLDLYARFLDPKTYLGFPQGSYTYVASAQVGAFMADVPNGTALPESRYAESVSDIFQARTLGGLETRLTSLGETRVQALATAWSEANPVTLSGYLLFAALGLALASLRTLPCLFR